MRIELIGHNDGPSGAGKAMARLHSGLLGQGISSTMHVAQSHSLLEQTRMPEGSHRAIRSLRAVLGRIPLKAIYPHRSASSHFSTNFGAGGALRGILKTAPELLHFHWINGGFCHVAEFKTPRVPMVWTIHDSWPFTGGCHVIGDCERFTQSCGSCPQLRSSSKWDLSRVQHRTKRKAYAKTSLNLITPSVWMKEQVQRSALLSGFPVQVIPNAIDTTVFRPFDRLEARSRLGLPQNARIILYGAINARSDTNKGFDLFQKAIKILSSNAQAAAQPNRSGQGRGRTEGAQKNTVLALFGTQRWVGPRSDPALPGLPVYSPGTLYDDLSLAMLYSAADVMCVPSRQESFGQTAAEALACSTPVAAFRTSGLKDIVEHKESGYLAEPYDPEDLARAMEFCLQNPALGNRGRQRVVDQFDSAVVSRSHIEMYKSILPLQADS